MAKRKARRPQTHTAHHPTTMCIIYIRQIAFGSAHKHQALPASETPFFSQTKLAPTAADNQMVAEDSESMFPITLRTWHQFLLQFKEVAPFLLPWLVPGMRHDRDEAMFIYETLSYTLATFALLQRKHKDLARFKNVTTACSTARSSYFWTAINRELGNIRQLAWHSYMRIHEIHGHKIRDLRRPARRQILRNRLWHRNGENKLDIFWEQTMIMRGRWPPNFALTAADNQMVA